MADILIIYSTTDGHTGKISRHLQQQIEQYNHRVEVICLDDNADVELEPFDKIIVGASIRYGKHSKQVYEFINKNRQILESRANAFFSVNMVARKPAKRQPDTNPYVRKFLRQIPWRPQQVAVFAGKIDYPRYSFGDRTIIRFIMWMTRGPTDPATVKEFTDWDQVNAFARVISEM